MPVSWLSLAVTPLDAASRTCPLTHVPPGLCPVCRVQILTPLQKARLVALSYPSFPDILQIVQAVRRQIAAAAPEGSGEAGSLQAQ